MADEVERTKTRVKRANDRLDQVWPNRVNDPQSTRGAVDELNDAVKALARALDARDPTANELRRRFAKPA